MGRRVLVMRHAKSSWSETGQSDFDRKLARRGKRDATRMGQELFQRGVVPDVIVSSGAKRARSTAKRVVKSIEFSGDIVYAPDLYGGGVNACLAALSGLPDELGCAMIIGHNPTLEELVALLGREHVRMTAGAVACIDSSAESWREVVGHTSGRLRFVLRPRELW